MRPKLRLGILGTGIAARKLYLPAFERLKHRVELVACANRTREKAEEYARLASIPLVVDSAEELFALPGVDGVLISLPIDAQPEYVLRALAAKKPVLSEKPVAATTAQGRKLIAKAARYRTPWLVGENFAFMQQAERLFEWIARGKLGEVRLVQATQMTLMDRKNPYFHTSWRTAPNHPGGFVLDAGVHIAHLLRRGFGMPARIQNLTQSFNPELPPLDTALATFEFTSGALGSWTSCFSARYEGPILRVYGSRANAELGYRDVVLRDARGRETRFTPKHDSFTRQFAHFADVVLEGEKPRVTPADALLDLALMEAIVKPTRRSGRRARSRSA
jgi:predicted dehydrogenase